MSFGLFYGIIGLLVFLYAIAKQLQSIRKHQYAVYGKPAYPMGEVLEAFLISLFSGMFWPVLVVIACFVGIAG